MSFKIEGYDPKYIKAQVDLIWEVTENWRYPYQTSHAAIKQNYSSQNFDPTTRFYAVDGDNFLGYITSSVVKNSEKGDYGTIRFPIVKNNDMEISSELLTQAENRFRELGINKIRAPAGVGMGNTMQLAEKFGFTQKSTIFKRSKITLTELKTSGDIGEVVEFTDPGDEEGVRKLFTSKMGMSEKEGSGFFDLVIGNKRRKEETDKKMVSWQLQKNEDEITAFSYLHRSDHNKDNGNFAPVYVSTNLNYAKVLDSLLSTHVKNLRPAGLKNLQTYLPPALEQLEPIYNGFGFYFDATFSYEKELI